MNLMNITFPPNYTCLSNRNDFTDKTGLAWEDFDLNVQLREIYW